MPASMGDAAQVRKIIEQAFEASQELSGPSRDFVTRSEFARDMDRLEQRLEVRLENSMLKTRNWVLGGIIASSVMFGGGFLSLMSKFDRTADAVMAMQVSLDQRRTWIDESDERNRRQDEVLKAVRPTYTPKPFDTRPK